MSQEQEIRQLQFEVQQLRQRLEAVQRRLDGLLAAAPPATVGVASPPLLTQPPVIPPPIPQPPAPPSPATAAAVPPVAAPPVLPASGVPPAQPPASLPVAAESLEVRLGTYWLPRLGMALLLLGMVFLVTWGYRYMAPAGKVVLSYACCAALAGLGWWLERRMVALARVLQAGALGLTYFVTYAAHYVDSFRVVHQPAVALAMLAVVVAGIVVLADRRQSPTLAGLALFFGYLTTVSSGVATFTLAANALLVVAALVFLARNRWVPLALGAVLATYVAYALWVWKVSDWRELGRLIFEAGYLDESTFRLRAAFLILYGVLFSAAALVLRREAMSAAERVGLVTLNHALFFVLFSLLLHHAHPGRQWMFQLLFGGTLLLLSAAAYQRERPERSLMDALLLQGLAVATLGLFNYLSGVNLVVVLALESLFLLWLAGAMNSRAVDWLGRATFAAAAVYVWSKLPDWDTPLIVAAGCTAAIGMLCARQVKRLRPGAEAKLCGAAVYFGLLAVGLLLTAVREQLGWAARPWGWLGSALVVAVLGGLLRSRELLWLANVPLAWAHLQFYVALGRLQFRHWPLDQALALVGLTLAFGLAVWSRQRAQRAEQLATVALLPYSLAAIAALLALTFDVWDRPVLVSLLAGQGLVLFAAGLWLNEPALRGPALVPIALAHVVFYLARLDEVVLPLDHSLFLIAITLCCGVLWRGSRAVETTRLLWPFALAAVVVALVTTFDHVPREWWLALFALQALILTLTGTREFVWLALAPVAAGTAGFFFTEAGRLGVPLVAWTNAVAALVLLVAAERCGRRQQVSNQWGRWVVLAATVVTLAAAAKLLTAALVTLGWAVGGFMLLALGFAGRTRPYRIAGLVMLALAVVRAFLYDLAKVETIYRILSFLALGIILLALAFLYTRNRDRLSRWL